MRQFYVCFLSNKHRSHQPFDVLFPAGNPGHQFDTIEAAKLARSGLRSLPSHTGVWEIVDLWATLKSPTLVIIQ